MQPGLCGSGLGQISGNVCVCVDGVDQCGLLQKQSMYFTSRQSAKM